MKDFEVKTELQFFAMMRRCAGIVSVCIFTMLLASCSLRGTSTPIAPTGTVIVTAEPTVLSGNTVTINNVSLTIAESLAKEALTEMVSGKTEPNTAPWEVAPDHIKIILTGYQLQNKFHEPQILVYPADEFAQLNSFAPDQIDRLKKILAGAPPMKETLPGIPFFNAGPLIAANIERLEFHIGSGVRHLTQYDQYPAPINNHELFYLFEGLTEDQKYYVIAILPVTAPILAENEKPDSSVPTDGIPIPTDVGPNDTYYASITEKLVSLPSDSFVPSLSALDSLIQSITITNP